MRGRARVQCDLVGTEVPRLYMTFVHSTRIVVIKVDENRGLGEKPACAYPRGDGFRVSRRGFGVSRPAT